MAWNCKPHDPIMEQAIYKRIIADPTDPNARQDLFENNLSKAFERGERLLRKVVKYGMDPQDYYSFLANLTKNCAFSPTYIPLEKTPTFEAYLGKSIVNRTKNLFKRLSRNNHKQPASLDELNEQNPSSDLEHDLNQTGAQENLMRTESISLLRRAIAEGSLTKEEEEFIRIGYLSPDGEKTPREMAAICGWSLGKVNEVKQRALKKLLRDYQLLAGEKHPYTN